MFLGEMTDDRGARGFVLQDTVSYVQYGSGLDGDEQHEEVVLCFMTESDVDALHDGEKLAAAVNESAQRAASLDHPILRASGKGQGSSP